MQQTLLFSIALNDYDRLFYDCIKTHRNYSSRSDYNYLLIKSSPFKMTGEESAWLKIFLLREALNMEYKWIAFIDADCEIREHAPDFRKYMAQLDPNASIYIAHGFSGRINSGVIFMKNTPEAMAYLQKVIENKDNPVPEEDKAPFENGHMIKYGKDNPSVKIIDNRLWNNNMEFDPESYIQHYSGGKLRPLYLQKHPVASSIYRLKKKWKFYSGKYKRADSAQLESLIPWFKKNYPEFNKK